MKFIHYLESIAGIGLYPMVSLALFFAFFSGLILYVSFSSRAAMDARGRLPLEEPEPSTPTDV